MPHTHMNKSYFTLLAIVFGGYLMMSHKAGMTPVQNKDCTGIPAFSLYPQAVSKGIVHLVGHAQGKIVLTDLSPKIILMENPIFALGTAADMQPPRSGTYILPLPGQEDKPLYSTHFIRQ